MKTGLNSVTFKSLSAEEIIKIVAAAGLDGIEWSANDHVKPGDISRAKEVRLLAEKNGLSLPSYGSYYKAGDSNNHKDSFLPILESAIALGAKTIRVWAGTTASSNYTPAARQLVIDDLCHIGQLAAQEGILIACEYHCNTLTDTSASALDLAQAVAPFNVKLYWQPPNGAPVEYSLAGLKAILPFLAHLHIFAWDCSGKEIVRLALAEGQSWWQLYLAEVRKAVPDCWIFIEFVKDNQIEQFKVDAKTLKQWSI